MNGTEPITKQDLNTALKDLERDLKAFILEREISSIRWLISIFGALQVTYFFGTMAMVYFLITHVQKAS
jgi:hypothetical protein